MAGWLAGDAGECNCNSIFKQSPEDFTWLGKKLWL